MSNSEDELSYHDSLMSFNDGKDFFEAVLGGMQKNEEDASSENEDEDESSSDEDSTGCKCANNVDSDSESPFIIEEEPFEQDESPFIIEESEESEESEEPEESEELKGDNTKKNISIGGDKDDESPLIVYDLDTESDTTDDLEVSKFIVDSEDLSISDIQDVIGGLLQSF